MKVGPKVEKYNNWGVGLLGLVISLAMRKTDGFEFRRLH